MIQKSEQSLRVSGTSSLLTLESCDFLKSVSFTHKKKFTETLIDVDFALCSTFAQYTSLWRGVHSNYGLLDF